MADQKLNPAEEFLQKIGLSFEDLDKPGYMGEKEAYFDLLNQTKQNPLTVETIRKSIMNMRYAVEMELTDPKHDPKQDIYLKARLRNYILLESFLYSPINAMDTHQADIKELVSTKK